MKEKEIEKEKDLVPSRGFYGRVCEQSSIHGLSYPRNMYNILVGKIFWHIGRYRFDIFIYGIILQQIWTNLFYGRC